LRPAACASVQDQTIKMANSQIQALLGRGLPHGLVHFEVVRAGINSNPIAWETQAAGDGLSTRAGCSGRKPQFLKGKNKGFPRSDTSEQFGSSIRYEEIFFHPVPRHSGQFEGSCLLECLLGFLSAPYHENQGSHACRERNPPSQTGHHRTFGAQYTPAGSQRKMNTRQDSCRHIRWPHDAGEYSSNRILFACYGFREGQEERLMAPMWLGFRGLRGSGPRFSSTRLFNESSPRKPFTLTYPRFRVRISGCSGSVGPSSAALMARCAPAGSPVTRGPRPGREDWAGIRG